jgi:hypothetical protein
VSGRMLPSRVGPVATEPAGCDADLFGGATGEGDEDEEEEADDEEEESSDDGEEEEEESSDDEIFERGLRKKWCRWGFPDAEQWPTGRRDEHDWYIRDSEGAFWESDPIRHLEFCCHPHFIASPAMDMCLCVRLVLVLAALWRACWLTRSVHCFR